MSTTAPVHKNRIIELAEQAERGIAASAENGTPDSVERQSLLHIQRLRWLAEDTPNFLNVSVIDFALLITLAASAPDLPKKKK